MGWISARLGRTDFHQLQLLNFQRCLASTYPRSSHDIPYPKNRR